VDALLKQIARDAGTPCFVYFMDQVRQRVRDVRAAFGNRFQISYAVKSNPNPGVLIRMREVVDTLDVSSAGEIVRAAEAGWDMGNVGFTGPGKTADELRCAVRMGVAEIIVESLDEAALLNDLAGTAATRQRVLVRIAPTSVPRGFGVNMSGKGTQFGIDEEDADPAIEAVRRLPHLELCGFHVYSGTQCLKADAIAENYEIFAELFTRLCRRHAVRPQRLVFGSGIGIPHYERDVPVELAAVAERVNPVLDDLKRESLFADTELALETGRYLIGEAGVFVTAVVRVKHSRGTDIGICDGGMNHHLAATGHLGAVVPRNYQMFKITDAPADAAEQPYTLVGPLCTTIDTLGRQVMLRGLAAGDLIGIKCSGAYGLTASPIHFISHRPPREVIVERVHDRLVVEDCSQFGDRTHMSRSLESRS
jgi:diaminopimelate decarboxylase